MFEPVDIIGQLAEAERSDEDADQNEPDDRCDAEPGEDRNDDARRAQYDERVR